MRKIALTSGLSGIAAVAFAIVTASPVKAQYCYGGYGPGMMGPEGHMMGRGMMGHMMGPGMGPGMMGPGRMGGYGQEYGPGMMGPGQYGRQGNLHLSTNDVKNYLERWIAVHGNPRLKVGDVKEKEADTIEADVVTKDNSLVQRFIVNRHTGFYQPSGS